jgi:hypothetical protein
MVNYGNGKIYKLVDKNSYKLLHVGATSIPLSKRMVFYRARCAENKQIPLYMDINDENVAIVLVCNFPCTSREELFAELFNQEIKCKRAEHYRANAPAFRAQNAKYRIENKERIQIRRNELLIENKEHNKTIQQAYQIKHKEQIKAHRLIRHECECGGTYSNGSKSKHFKSKRHIEDR